jgi:hypothetical protein
MPGPAGETVREQRIRALERRVQEALRESPEMRERSTFSEYAPRAAAPISERLERAASAGGIKGVESVLDEFDWMSLSEDPLALRYALQLFLTHNRHSVALGLRVPPLAERSPWMTVPSRRNDDGET